MKKIIIPVLLILTTFAFSQTKRIYNIGILLDNKTEELAPLVEQLKSQIVAIVGEDATIEFPSESFLVNDYDLQKAEQNYQTLLNNSTDIILAFGAINSLVISKQTRYLKPTILFSAINKDLTNVDLSKTTSQINNFTYLVESQSYIEDLQKLKELTNFKNVGVIVESQFINVVPIKEALDKTLQALGANYTLIPFKSLSDITNNLNTVDAVYLAEGFFLNNEEIAQLAKVLIQKKIPSFTNTDIDDVKAGLMATNQSDDNGVQFMRRIALNVEAYINGRNLSTLPIYIQYSPRLTINYNTAEAVNVPIKYSLIANTDFVGNMVNSISKKNYNLLDVIDQVVNKNLSLQSEQKNILLSEQDLKTAKSNYLPTLTASGTGTYIDPNVAELSGGQNPEFSTDGSIALTQTLFSEAANANITIQKSLLKAQEENFNASQLDAIFNASNAYFTTLILKANAQIQLRNLNLTKKNLQIAQQNFETGESGKSDMLRFQSEIAQNTQAMVEAVNNLEQGFISLNQLLNNPLDSEIDVENAELEKGVFEQYNYNELTQLLDDPKLREPFVAFLIDEAKNNAPELKGLNYNLDAVNRQIKLYGSGRLLPTVALQGQYNREFNRSGVGTEYTVPNYPNDNYNAVVSLSLPIFNQNTNKINRQAASIQKDQLQINKDNTELNIDANIRNSVLNLINQISNIELSKISEAAAKESLELTQTSYSTGAVTVIQLIDAQNNYLNSQIAGINATYNYLINALQLERYLGYYFVLNSKADNDRFRQRFLEFTNSKN